MDVLPVLVYMLANELFLTWAIVVYQCHREDPRHNVPIFSICLLAVNAIQARKAPMSLLYMYARHGSEKGTLHTISGRWEAVIYSLNLNQMSTLPAVSSAHDTMHMFKLEVNEGSTNRTWVDSGATSPPELLDSPD